MLKGRLILGVLVIFLLHIYGVYAVGVSLNDNGTLGQTTISSASNLYAYEVNFDYSGSISGVQHANFLGSGQSYGFSTRNNILSVYGSRLDSTQTGISGSGSLFNVTHSGSLTLRCAVFIDSSGDEDYVYYNNANSPGTCSSAASSSGSTSTSTSGSAGGGSGGAAGGSQQVDIIVVPTELNLNLVLDLENTREITIRNNGENAVILGIEIDGFSNIVEAPTSVSIGVGEEISVPFVITPRTTELITGRILLKNGASIVKEIPVVINVRTANFLFDSSILVLDDFKKSLPGTKIKAQVNLLQVGPKEKVDVTARYVVKDFLGKTYLEETETFFVLESKEFIREIGTENLGPGKYVLGLEISYPGAFASSSSQFEIIGNDLARYYPILAGVVSFIAILSIAVIVWALAKGHKTRKKLRRR